MQNAFLGMIQTLASLSHSSYTTCARSARDRAAQLSVIDQGQAYRALSLLRELLVLEVSWGEGQHLSSLVCHQ